MPMREQALMDRLHGRLGRIPLGHGSFGRVGQSSVAQVERQMAELARHSQERLGLGQWKRYALVLSEWSPKRLAFLDVLPGLVQGGLRRCDALQADQCA